MRGQLRHSSIHDAEMQKMVAMNKDNTLLLIAIMGASGNGWALKVDVQPPAPQVAPQPQVDCRPQPRADVRLPCAAAPGRRARFPFHNMPFPERDLQCLRFKWSRSARLSHCSPAFP